jgi:hypothetical protein
MGRNTQILEEIINVLHLSNISLEVLEEHFQDRLILDVGSVSVIEVHAKQLRLRVEKEELALVLDYIAQNGIVSITIDAVEEAVNSLLGEDRFIEPER